MLIKYIAQLSTVITAALGGGIYLLLHNNYLTSNDESITLDQENILDSIKNQIEIKPLKNVVEQQLEKINAQLSEKKKLPNWSTNLIYQEEITKLTQNFNAINDAKQDLQQQTKKLNDSRKEYGDYLKQIIAHIKKIGSNGYIKYSFVAIKRSNEYYGNYLNYPIKQNSITRHDGKIVPWDKDYVDVFTSQEKGAIVLHSLHPKSSDIIPYGKTENDVFYTKVHTNINLDFEHKKWIKSYKGIELTWNLYQKHQLFLCFIDYENPETIRSMGNHLEIKAQNVKQNIKKYIYSINQNCETTHMFGYENIETCKNEIYEPLTHLDY